MPIISTFFGIIIRMYFGDHNPPHFHVEFQGEKATVNFDGQLLAGTISPEQRGNWCATGLVVTGSNS
jgi:hypothetical protein